MARWNSHLKQITEEVPNQRNITLTTKRVTCNPQLFNQMPAIEVNNLYKNYFSEKTGKFAGVGKPTLDGKPAEGISFSVNEGEVFGIIGPDGAGKTTLFRMLTTLVLPDKGSARVDGFDVVDDYKEIRNRVGYMPGRFSLYQDLTVEENLNFFATVFNTTIEENYDLVKDIYQQIEPFKTRRAGKLSGGMKQKLALSCALIHKPSVLFLDEPTTGVDPVSRKEFWGILKKLKEKGITILVSTPYMDEASLCDRIALIQNGQFLKIDTPPNIIAGYENKLWAVQSNRMSKLLKDLRANEAIRSCFAFGDKHHATINKPGYPAAQLHEYLQAKGHTGIHIFEIEPTIEDCFMQLSKTPEQKTNSNTL
ncbi:MAG TPA: ABC transporter ATP-binding protein [Paludibacter sp.]|nr:ABC transporter ATP-binding protein [Paludibacter sp.]